METNKILYIASRLGVSSMSAQEMTKRIQNLATNINEASKSFEELVKVSNTLKDCSKQFPISQTNPNTRIYKRK